MKRVAFISLLALFSVSLDTTANDVVQPEIESLRFGLKDLLTVKRQPARFDNLPDRLPFTRKHFDDLPLAQTKPNSPPKRGIDKADATKNISDTKIGELLPIHLDPYIPGRVRATFLATAGEDGELSQHEFDESAVEKNLSRPFDYWENILLFDQNKNATLDYIEFDSYRRFFRARTILAYDDDRNLRLEGDEIEQAEKDLRRGDLFKLEEARIARPKKKLPPKPSNPAPRTAQTLYYLQLFDATAGENGIIERKEFETRFVEKDGFPAPQWKHVIVFDKNNDGRISKYEYIHFNTAYTLWQARQFDEDRDGNISDHERNAILKHCQIHGIPVLTEDGKVVKTIPPE